MIAHRLSRWLLAGLASLTLVACIPIPVISVSPSPVIAGEEVSFDASETMISNVPEDNVAVSYDWDFGDGNSGDGKTVTHTYEKAGTYKVTLTVVLLIMAPQVVKNLDWLALLAGFVVTIKVYWLAWMLAGRHR